MTTIFTSIRPRIPAALSRTRQQRWCSVLALMGVLAITSSPHAADVTVQPAAGSGFVVKDASGASERLRVQESGMISLPGMATAPAQAQGVCISAAGQLGPCSNTNSGAYTASTGLALTGTTFSVAPTYQLPQACAANQFAQWNGTAWACGTAGGGAALPVGKVNQTVRYDASNTLVANDLLQAFSDGGLWAGGTLGAGTIPTTGTGARMMWHPAKAAFRAGWVNTNVWDDANIGQYSIALGENNKANGSHAVAMGGGTGAAGDYSFAMGYLTSASGPSSIAMGSQVSASGSYSVAMGYQAQAGGPYAFAAGNNSIATGESSIALGSYAKAPGDGGIAIGSLNTADGTSSIVMGLNASSNGHDNVFVYNDGFYPGFTPAQDRVFMAAAQNGFSFHTGTDDNPLSLALVPGSGATFITGLSSGVKVAVGSGSWTSLSDRNAKVALHSVDVREVLEKVAALPMSTWQYKSQDAQYRHLGPMAQDFYAAFKLGESDTGIDVVDADGVALAAIQGLNSLLAQKDAKANKRLDEKDREIAALNAELAAQKAEIAAQRTRVVALESLADDLAEVKAQLAALRKSSPEVVAVVSRQP